VSPDPEYPWQQLAWTYAICDRCGRTSFSVEPVPLPGGDDTEYWCQDCMEGNR